VLLLHHHHLLLLLLLFLLQLRDVAQENLVVALVIDYASP
jgi:hypothetical protein